MAFSPSDLLLSFKTKNKTKNFLLLRSSPIAEQSRRMLKARSLMPLNSQASPITTSQWKKAV
jgi:hypothetical protein